MNSSKVLLGVLGGIAVGAIAGVLLAPDKGSKTRKRILNTGKGYANDLKGKLEDLSKEVTNKYESFVGDAKDAISNQIK
ncbi:MAG: YtxH domain-containing protein [Bacteroidota bacterium]